MLIIYENFFLRVDFSRGVTGESKRNNERKQVFKVIIKYQALIRFNEVRNNLLLNVDKNLIKPQATE